MAVGAEGDDAVLSVELLVLEEEKLKGIFHRSMSTFGTDQVV